MSHQVSFEVSTNHYPYRSYNKLKSLYDDVDKNRIKHFNNFNLAKAKKDYSLKAYSTLTHTLIGDIFFDKASAFLLLINVNTRFAYAYQLGEVNTTEIINVDTNNKEFSMTYATRGRKTTKELIKAFNSHLSQHPVNLLRFDGESAINSPTFQRYLSDHHIQFDPAHTHSSLGLIDRLCRTIRDIAFNLGYKGIFTQLQMDRILNFYNTSRHETLTQTLFQAYPALKSKHSFISPLIVSSNKELETLYVKECIKHNLFTSSQSDFELAPNATVKVVSDEGPFAKKRSILSKDSFKVINKDGNVYELTNTKTGHKVFKPRFEIKAQK